LYYKTETLSSLSFEALGNFWQQHNTTATDFCQQLFPKNFFKNPLDKFLEPWYNSNEVGKGVSQMKDKELMNLGFGVYIHKADVLGLYGAGKKHTMRRMTSKTNAPMPNQVLNNLNGRECLSYVETPFHIYLCAYPVEVLVEEYTGEHTEENDRIRESLDSEDYVSNYMQQKSDTYYGLYLKKMEEAKESARKEWEKMTLEKQRKEASDE